MLRHTKPLWILTLTALLLSCENSEPAPSSIPTSEVIAFRATANETDNNRAATLVGNKEDMREKPFCIFGDLTDDNHTETVFNKVNITYDKNESCWTYSPIEYWAPSGQYEFRAFWPASNPIANTSTTSTLALEYNMMTQNDDLMVAYKSCPTKSPSVSLNFRHALSAVAVKFQTNDNTREYYIKNIYFTGLYYSGTLLYDSADEKPDLSNAWRLAERSDVDINGNASIRIREWSKDEGEKIPQSAADYPEEFNLFIPQSLQVSSGHSKPSISITVDIKIDGETTEMTFSLTLPDTDASGTPFAWQAGKKYVYIIKDPLADYSITVNTTEWDEINASVGDIEF